MAKHLVDLDEEALRAARVELGTTTLKDTVNESLRRVARERDGVVTRSLGVLADASLADREDAWR
jgi:Arc/MetJ family transcription regulator